MQTHCYIKSNPRNKYYSLSAIIRNYCSLFRLASSLICADGHAVVRTCDSGCCHQLSSAVSAREPDVGSLVRSPLTTIVTPAPCLSLLCLHLHLCFFIRFHLFRFHVLPVRHSPCRPYTVISSFSSTPAHRRRATCRESI